VIDVRVIRALHVERFRKAGMPAERGATGALFQTSTLDALLDGAYDGDVTFAELAERGDLGLGTLNGLDGEMIALDGEFHQARVDGSVRRIASEERTPFAVVTRFQAEARSTIDSSSDHAALLKMLDTLVPDAALCYAIRLDGFFESVRARSVPRQKRPYLPFSEVVAQQVEFELTQVAGSIVGFRFPDYVQGLNVPGYHLHFISDDRSSGGHVLDCRISSGHVQVDHSSDLHMELPAGVGWAEPDTSVTKQNVIAAAEGET
jgi:acetolactate decarboxylase